MSNQVLAKATRRARKKHYCSLCAGPIRPGDTYEDATYKYDHIYQWKTCQPCLDDDVTNIVTQWVYSDEGVTDEDAYEWACESNSPAAQRFLERTNL